MGSRSSWSVRVGISALAVVLTIALGVTAAAAHQPLFLDDDDPTPTIVDGTVSFATYGRIAEPGGSVAVDVALVAGDELVIELLVPDRPPEAERPDHSALEVTVVAPSGASTVLPAGAVLGRFDEPFSSTSYLRLVAWTAPAEGGTYRVSASSAVPTRLVLVTGRREVPGEVIGYTGPDGSALGEWYEQPVGLDRVGDAIGSSGTVGPPSTEVAGEGDGGSELGSPDTGAGQRRDVIGRSAGWPILVAVLAMMAFISLLAWRPWRRHHR